ncbi:MAG: CPBP family glutamic-type intramembrane protease [bacterium]|nr:CPBP family glutamic-type intramembrane protease [bacterium]
MFSLYSGVRTAFWLPIVVTVLLFSLAHVAVDLDPARLAVFFPGLLFGWLRAKTGTLLAPILSHGSANLLSMLLINTVS